MSDEALDRFRGYLLKRAPVTDLDQEVLRHEMGATINRHRLTGRDEGMQSFNTSQLCGLVVAQHGWTREQVFVTGLILSALVDGEFDIYQAAKDEGILPPSWNWLAWADGFSGTEAELVARLAAVPFDRERSGAVALATRNRPEAIGNQLLGDFCDPALATVYHRLLRLALTGPHADQIAAHELVRLVDHLEILFAADVDATLALLVRATSMDHPEILIAPFRDAAGELTRTALAQRHLERGRAQEALAMVKDLRFLSSAYDQAILVAALAALECGKFEMAEFYCRNIADEDTRLKIVTRVAQASGDVGAEVDALTTLYERNQHDVQVFIQLINVLMRIGQTALVSALCADAQERFDGDPAVNAIIRRVLTNR